MLPVLNLGPLALPVPHLLLIAGLWIGLELAEKHAERYGAQGSDLYNLVLTSGIAALIGARLGYAARSPAAFLENPLTLLAPRAQMLDATGGLIAALLATAGFLLIRRLPIWPVLDALTSLLAVMGVVLGLSHLASGDAFGAPAGVPWAIELWGAQRHPTQAYEIMAALAVAAATWPGGPLGRASQTGRTAGLRFWSFLALSAAARLIIETFRGDSILWLNLFRQAQVIAWLLLAVSMWQIGRRLAAMDTPGEPSAPAEPVNTVQP